jgi:hypothetical protein
MEETMAGSESAMSKVARDTQAGTLKFEATSIPGIWCAFKLVAKMSIAKNVIQVHVCRDAPGNPD